MWYLLRLQEEKKLRESLFGPLKPLTWDEYQKIYDETGLDIDGRKKVFMECLTNVNYSETINEHYVNFFKDIPGFKDLPFDDQVSLIRGKSIHSLLTQTKCHAAWNVCVNLWSTKLLIFKLIHEYLHKYPCIVDILQRFFFLFFLGYNFSEEVSKYSDIKMGKVYLVTLAYQEKSKKSIMCGVTMRS